MANIKQIKVIRAERCTSLEENVNEWLDANAPTNMVEDIRYIYCVRLNQESAYLAIIHYRPT
jgi:hypothetical protein